MGVESLSMLSAMLLTRDSLKSCGRAEGVAWIPARRDWRSSVDDLYKLLLLRPDDQSDLLVARIHANYTVFQTPPTPFTWSSRTASVAYPSLRSVSVTSTSKGTPGITFALAEVPPRLRHSAQPRHHPREVRLW